MPARSVSNKKPLCFPTSALLLPSNQASQLSQCYPHKPSSRMLDTEVVQGLGTTEQTNLAMLEEESSRLMCESLPQWRQQVLGASPLKAHSLVKHLPVSHLIGHSSPHVENPAVRSLAHSEGSLQSSCEPPMSCKEKRSVIPTPPCPPSNFKRSKLSMPCRMGPGSLLSIKCVSQAPTST